MNDRRNRRDSQLLLCSALWLIAGCEPAPQLAEEAPALSLRGDMAQAAVETYANIAQASYADSVSAVRDLLATVQAFLQAPSAARLERARAAWLAARVPYTQTEVFRFYDGPIDAVEHLVNSWPIDESYVESNGAADGPGIIQNTQAYPELSVELLRSLNERDGETAISSGFHVIELLLWGPDRNPDGPGRRAYTDFVVAEGEPGTVAARRGRYLELATEALLVQLESVHRQWAKPSNSYRARWLSLPAPAALALAVKGMGMLSGPELSGERLTVPYETKDQENEHSCFSDSTERDVVGDALGIENVCLGRYARVDGLPVHGTGVCDAVAQEDTALGQALREQISASVQAARAIPAPFDRAILGADAAPGRKAIAATIAALALQARTLGDVAARFEPEPPSLLAQRR